MAAYKNYYDILGVPKTATQKEIRTAFRKLAAKHHPDRNPDDPTAEEKFKEINEAYTVLTDEEKRKFYDQYGSAEGRPPFQDYSGQSQGFQGSVNPEDLHGFSDFFQSLFGGAFSGAQTRVYTSGGPQADPFQGFGQSQQRHIPQDAEGSITVSLEAAYHGGVTTISIDGKHIEVTLPKGTRDGSRLRLKGQAPGGGDLYLAVKLEKHPTFKLEGDNVRVIVNVPDYQAVLGGSVRVPTLDGDVEMTLPKGTQSGRVLRLRGQGWPKRTGGRGDELAEVRVTIPKAPSAEQQKLYEQLQQLAGKVQEAAD
jgi:curved DNA-binding protein